MEQAKCLNIGREHKIVLGDNNNLPITKTMKRFNNQQSPISSSLWEDYQEEEAFSDSAILGAQGGSLMTWPPRSYSCSFCKREFRSAQALGGHMNVHRRDRALLKQVAINSNDDLNHINHHDDHVINPSPSKSKPPNNQNQSHSQVCSSPMINNNVVVAHHSPSRVSSNSVISNGISKAITTINDGIDQDQPKMSMGLDLAVGAYRSDEDIYHQEEFSKYNKKRFKKSNDDFYNYNVALFQFLDDEIKCSNVEDNGGLEVQEVLNIRASKSMEELDLELRLGEPLQKIK